MVLTKRINLRYKRADDLRQFQARALPGAPLARLSARVRQARMVELAGIEPATSALQRRRSPS
jgi:hypothetical protein